MTDTIAIFISHVSADESIALSLKDYLEGIFLNASVFVSGRDLVGGQVWIEELRRQLEAATAILAVISPLSVSSKWVHFEAGAGLCRRCTIPLLVPGMTVEDVGPPLSLLQLRRIDQSGLETMARDIAGLGNMRLPARFPGLEKALQDITSLLALRAEQESVEREDVDDEAADEDDLELANPSGAEEQGVDPDLERLVADTKELVRTVMARAIRPCEASFDIPSDEELHRMPIVELYSLASAVGLLPPLGLLTLGMQVPRTADPAWKKATERSRIEALRTDLEKFEASLEARRLTSR
jgi:hypothetical protein